ncbi:hypothetical protein EJ04DRAFT_513371 [Polyplosphaeria fusca]|uniref:Uncharacterized protein n=1 Tax=Polyplosphaeria fusca TaxID=682080 RepID=A0A9P4QXT8_9PLEO|nr:hypothetical protein EJ04DRAFT_513371 [Polyplosphaeria fusca]
MLLFTPATPTSVKKFVTSPRPAQSPPGTHSNRGSGPSHKAAPQEIRNNSAANNSCATQS